MNLSVYLFDYYFYSEIGADQPTSSIGEQSEEGIHLMKKMPSVHHSLPTVTVATTPEDRYAEDRYNCPSNV